MVLAVMGADANAARPAAGSAGAVPAVALALNPSWKSLTPAQQDVLRPLASEWDQLDSAHKGKWLEIANRFPQLAPEHQQRLRDRMAAWTRMSPAERQQARISYQRASELRAAEQQPHLQAKWEAYQALSPEQKQRLAERAAEKAAEKASAAKPGAAAPARGDRVTLRSTPAAMTLVPQPAPAVIQARPGATTLLLTQRAEPAATATSAPTGRPLRSPREAGLDPHTLRPQPASGSR